MGQAMTAKQTRARAFAEKVAAFARVLEEEGGERLAFVLVVADVTTIGSRDRLDVAIKANAPSEIVDALIGIAQRAVAEDMGGGTAAGKA